MKQIDYYFWINSDWAYLGADRLVDLAERHGATVVHKPVDLLDVYARTGGIPLPERSKERQSYREAELRRWSKKLSIPLNITPRYMCPNGDLASRFTIAADQLGYSIAPLYKAILHAQWCSEQDISDPAVLTTIATGLNMPAAAIIEHAQTSGVEQSYRRNTDEAVAVGVFGSPTYVVGGELFWGQDRLEFLEDALAK